MNVLNFYINFIEIFLLIYIMYVFQRFFIFIERFLRQTISLSAKIRIEIIKGTLNIARGNGTKTFL